MLKAIDSPKDNNKIHDGDCLWCGKKANGTELSPQKKTSTLSIK